jgi:hypothetical protein
MGGDQNLATAASEPISTLCHCQSQPLAQSEGPTRMVVVVTPRAAASLIIFIEALIKNQIL